MFFASAWLGIKSLCIIFSFNFGVFVILISFVSYLIREFLVKCDKSGCHAKNVKSRVWQVIIWRKL